MKRTYQKPEIIGIYSNIVQDFLAESYIPVGGKGSFDVKGGNIFDDDDQQSSNVWNDDWSE